MAPAERTLRNRLRAHGRQLGDKREPKRGRTWRITGYRPLPRVNLACSGLAIGVSKTEWLKLAEKAAAAADPAARRDLFGTEPTC